MSAQCNFSEQVGSQCIMIYSKQLSLILEKLDHILWRKCPLGLGECWSLHHYHRRFSGLRQKWAQESELGNRTRINSLPSWQRWTDWGGRWWKTLAKRHGEGVWGSSATASWNKKGCRQTRSWTWCSWIGNNISWHAKLYCMSCDVSLMVWLLVKLSTC